MSGGLESLKRIAAPKPPPIPQAERCEMCAVEVGERHGHLADLNDHRLLCVCRPCYLLFAPQGAGAGRYRAVGEEVRRVGDLLLDDVRWDSLRVPVDLVFFFTQTGADGVMAFYPGPSGATESELGLDAWADIVSDNPVLASAAADVEAVLLRRQGQGEFSCYLVPVDRCYELVGKVRLAWIGLGGGPEVWRRIDDFFADLERRGHDVPRTGAA